MNLLQKIIIFVLATHTLVILLCIFPGWTRTDLSQKNSKQKIFVQTIELTNKKEEQVAIAQPESTKIIKSSPPSPIKPNKTTPAPKTEKKTTPQKNEKKEKLLAQALESIKKIQKVPAKVQSSKNAFSSDVGTPKFIGSLESEATTSTAHEKIYEAELINRLRLLLHMPEYGDVDIELTLAKSGKVISMKILRDENRNNRLYIEKVVPTFSFPPFGSDFEGEWEHTFFVRLTNVTPN